MLSVCTKKMVLAKKEKLIEEVLKKFAEEAVI